MSYTKTMSFYIPNGSYRFKVLALKGLSNHEDSIPALNLGGGLGFEEYRCVCFFFSQGT
jgi:hypothetical protein